MEFSTNMKVQIGDDLWTVHTAQLIYSMRQDFCSDPFYWMISYWLDQEIRKIDRDHQNIEIVAVPILCNAYVQLNYASSMHDKNIL